MPDGELEHEKKVNVKGRNDADLNGELFLLTSILFFCPKYLHLV